MSGGERTQERPDAALIALVQVRAFVSLRDRALNE